MPRKRLPHNAGLPSRWQHTHGAYYYRVPTGGEAAWDGKKRFRLGASLSEAHRTFAARIELPRDLRTVNDLLDRYELEVVPAKAPPTQESNQFAIKNLRRMFAGTPLAGVKPQHIYKYVDTRSKKVAARREVEVLSHAFTKAVEWGLLDRHPFRGEVRLKGEKPRERYLEDWELSEILSLSTLRKRGSVQTVHAYVRLKVLTGLRRGDLLRLRTSDLTDEGIAVRTNKTGKPVVYTWTPALRDAVVAAKAARPVDISPWLFCNRRGECYIDEETGKAPGWKSMWQRFVARVMKETKITEPFTDHDLRAKVASDAENVERARALLTHADARTTERVYRRKPERVKPTR